MYEQQRNQHLDSERRREKARGKWLELLKQIAPGVTRAAVLRDRADPSGAGHAIGEKEIGGASGSVAAAPRRREFLEMGNAAAARLSMIKLVNRERIH